jgi:hypothetical protein
MTSLRTPYNAHSHPEPTGIEDKEPTTPATEFVSEAQSHYHDQFLTSQDTSASSFEWDAQIIERIPGDTTGPGSADRPFFVNPLPMPLNRMVNDRRPASGRARAARVEANAGPMRRTITRGEAVGR